MDQSSRRLDTRGTQKAGPGRFGSRGAGCEHLLCRRCKDLRGEARRGQRADGQGSRRDAGDPQAHRSSDLGGCGYLFAQWGRIGVALCTGRVDELRDQGIDNASAIESRCWDSGIECGSQGDQSGQGWGFGKAMPSWPSDDACDFRCAWRSVGNDRIGSDSFGACTRSVVSSKVA